MVGGRYAPIIMVQDVPMMALQLTTFRPWIHVYSRLFPYGDSGNIATWQYAVLHSTSLYYYILGKF